MADLILGQPTNLTTVSASLAGNIVVTLAPWELDWEFFLGLAVDGTHYLANTTSAASEPIIAKGGAENTGYWFEIDQAFPDANWASGNRITPQRQAAILQYATPALAVAAMAMHDVFLMWYSTTLNLRRWANFYANFNAIAGSVWGMLSRSQILLVGGNMAGVVLYQGNLAAQVNACFVRNLSAFNEQNGVGICYAPAVGFLGAGLFPSRNIVMGAATDGNAGISIVRGTGITTNCLAVHGGVGFSGGLFYNCGAMFCSVKGFQFNNQASRNCFAVECTPSYTNAVNAQFCADDDGVLPVAAGNLRNQDVRTQIKLFFDGARAGNKAFPLDGRAHQDSVLTGAGVAGAGIPLTDADGRTRPNPPSIGPWEPYGTCYAPASEIIRGKRGAVA